MNLSCYKHKEKFISYIVRGRQMGLTDATQTLEFRDLPSRRVVWLG